MDMLNDIRNTLLPEAVLTAFILIIGILTIVLKKEKQGLIVWISLIGILFSLISTGFSLQGESFYESFVSSGFTTMFRIIILLGTAITICLSKDYIGCAKNEFINPILFKPGSQGEFYFLLFTATLGAMLLCGANDLIMLVVALETLSISSFALTGYAKHDRLSNEASLKYLIFGGVSTGLMLYGFSFIYGMTGHTNFNLIAANLPGYDMNFILIIAFILILAGFGFKISAVPFHSWTPDVYQGAPMPFAAYLSVVSKTAGFAILIRFLSMLFPDNILFSIIIAVLAAITMTIGNIMALNQQNIRRLMAYSSIAQAGYLLMALSVMSYNGVTAVIYYLLVYLFMNFGAWAAIEIFYIMSGRENIDDFKGLSHKYRYFSLGLTLCMLSLAGIPITAGFFGKFYLFMAVAASGYVYLPLLIIALINTVIALFYYMRVIKALYVQPKGDINYGEINHAPFALRAIFTVAVSGVLLLGIFAAPFIEFILRNS